MSSPRPAANTSGGHAEQNMMTPSNIITIARICLVPVFVVALLSPWPEWLDIDDIVTLSTKSVIACVIFVLISCTDWLDGYLARSRNEVTDFGKFADPLADKILVIAALLALVELQVLPSWPVLIIVTREFIISGIRMMAATKGVVIAASWYGKAKTVSQIIAIVLFLLKDTLVFPGLNYGIHTQLYVIAWIAMILALVLTIVSMLDYIKKAWPMFISTEDGASTTEDGSFCSRIEELSDSVVKKAISKGVSLSTAESLTGGMISTALTSIAGSSAVVRGGIVSYATEVKKNVVGVDGEVLRTLGAVSAEAASQMASAVREKLDSQISVSATGLAGPGGGSDDCPVGTVFIGFASETSHFARRYEFSGDREAVRMQSVIEALQLIDDGLDQI